MKGESFIRQKREGQDIPSVPSEKLEALKEQIAQGRLKILNFCRKKIFPPNETLAQDLTQATLEKAIKNAHKFRGDSQLGSWLLSIAFNEIRGHFRTAKAQKRGTEIPLSSVVVEGGSELSSLDSGVRRLTDEERILLRVDLEKAFKKLSGDEREVIQLALLDLDPGEVAKSLGISVPAAKSRLHRARLQLRELLAPYN